jgi:hypothetical protein
MSHNVPSDRDRQPEGRVGKTTTAINLGASLAVSEQHPGGGHRPPGERFERIGDSSWTGSPHRQRSNRGPTGREAIIRQIHFPTSAASVDEDLVGAEIKLVEMPDRERTLRKALEPIRDRYDFILVDCPPSLGLLTLNTLVADSSHPDQCGFYALELLAAQHRSTRSEGSQLGAGNRGCCSQCMTVVSAFLAKSPAAGSISATGLPKHHPSQRDLAEARTRQPIVQYDVYLGQCTATCRARSGRARDPARGRRRR